ncbi:MAG: hypothetical protein KAJ54_03405 [Candidatus Aenigmarchaeota archaeon]|nr:hypothetical protein [Candidatus Aenigmarchaeota archaeon]MCK5322231.1 hypothetical protein [Candidatus Aenigmarchaeota archaeon]
MADMKFKETMEYFLIVELAIMVVAVYLVLGGGLVDKTQTLNVLNTILLILIVGTQSLTAIILLRIANLK